MAPVRVGIIGLSSATENISISPGDGWAASAHLPYLLQSPYYEITALCNSSVRSAEAAVARHGLPSSTKAYASPEDIANDPNIDLVVCCVRVDRHYELMMPSLKAGKAAFVEWPLASNLQQAEEMLRTAKRSGARTIVGLQSRPSPFIQKVKSLVETKVIGDLLSSNLTYAIGTPGDVIVADYMADKKAGGNVFTIMFGHVADAVLYTLGGLNELSALLSTRWPEGKFLKPNGELEKMIRSDTPDHVMLQGTLSDSDAPVSIYMRHGKSFPHSPSLTWYVFGTRGEIRVTSHTLLSLGLGGEKIELFDHEKGTVEEIEVQYGREVKDLPMFAKNVGAMYELYAKGGTLDQGFVDFGQAVGMHRIIDSMERSNKAKRWEKILD